MGLLPLFPPVGAVYCRGGTVKANTAQHCLMCNAVHVGSSVTLTVVLIIILVHHSNM